MVILHHHETASSQMPAVEGLHRAAAPISQQFETRTSGYFRVSESQATVLRFSRILDCDVMHCTCECRRKIFQKVDNPIMSCEFCAKY